MTFFRNLPQRLILLAVCQSATTGWTSQQIPGKPGGFPYPEKLTYRIEWRTVTAGTATLDLTALNPGGWQTTLNLASTGWVSRLYRVLDSYRVVSNERFCGSSSTLDAQEGKRHVITRLTFQNSLQKVDYEERDLVKNAEVKKQLDILPCTYEITGALAALRIFALEPGKSLSLPVTDGRKVASAKVEGQAKESLNVGGRTYTTIRYEVFLFDNVLYRRKGRLFVWMTDDADRLPVQLRLQLGFPIGGVTIQLERHEKT
jgi:Protein of unknown function (DUF3108)